jgi:hypothetical protein
MEENSVSIDITDIKDSEASQAAFHEFNKKEEYYGRLTTVHKYLGHSFIETSWALESIGRKTILEGSITLEDETFIKGFPSLPADAQIVHVNLGRLPFHAITSIESRLRKTPFGLWTSIEPWVNLVWQMLYR